MLGAGAFLAARVGERTIGRSRSIRERGGSGTKSGQQQLGGAHRFRANIAESEDRRTNNAVCYETR